MGSPGNYSDIPMSLQFRFKVVMYGHRAVSRSIPKYLAVAVNFAVHSNAFALNLFLYEKFVFKPVY
jgi:hypothetical protein